MARRKATKKRQSRRRPKFNLVNAAQTYAQTAIITRAAFNVNPIEFVTGQQSITSTRYKSTSMGTVATGTTTSTGYLPVLNGTALTLPELFGFDMAGKAINAGGYSQFGNGGLDAMTQAVRENIRLNGGLMKPVIQTAVLNIGFAVGKKVFRKQLSAGRKGLKIAGLGRDVTV